MTRAAVLGDGPQEYAGSFQGFLQRILVGVAVGDFVSAVTALLVFFQGTTNNSGVKNRRIGSKQSILTL